MKIKRILVRLRGAMSSLYLSLPIAFLVYSALAAAENTRIIALSTPVAMTIVMLFLIHAYRRPREYQRAIALVWGVMILLSGLLFN